MNFIQETPIFKKLRNQWYSRRASLKRVLAKVQSLSVSNPLKYNCYGNRTMP